MTFSDEVSAGALEDRLAELRAERDRHKARAERQALELVELRKLLDFHDAVTQAKPRPPKWLAPKKKGGHKATVVTVLSDVHFDEVVNPAEVQGLNAYDRDIAEQRLTSYFLNVVKVSRDYLAGVEYDGAVLCLGGDMFSGLLHDLQETNADTLFGSLLRLSELLSAGVRLLAEEFGNVHVPVVVGNHGRLTRKPRTKNRARDNADWLLGHMVARHIQDDRVTFDIPDSADVRFDVYRTRFLLTHGDQTKGGGGIGGIWPPIKRMVQQKRTQYAHNPFDVLLCGHWHQLVWGGDFVVNGSLKGFDEYALLSRFPPERPQQALFLVTPDNGITFQAPVFGE